jgi:hypothetical protein
MLNDPRDPGAYRIAIAALGFAVAVLLAGICWIAAVHVTRDTVHVERSTVHVVKNDPIHEERVTVNVKKDPARLEMGRVPVELWFALAALGGVFIGALIPFSLRVRSSKRGCACEPDVYEPAPWVIAGALIVFLIFIASGIFGYSLRLYALETTIAGVLLGLPIPSPGRRDQ